MTHSSLGPTFAFLKGTMVRTNLISKDRHAVADKTWPFAVAFLALIVTGIFLTAPIQIEETQKPLGREEKEIVFSVISRLETNTPALHKMGEALRLAVENDLITLSPLFFENDPIAQESEIIQLIAKSL